MQEDSFQAYLSVSETLAFEGESAEMPAGRDPNRVGRYRVVEELSGGGMGIVYRAHDEQLDCQVAVKMMRDELASAPSAIERFIEEAQIAGQMQHPGVPPIHELGQLDDGRYFIAMKLVEGRNLAELLAERESSQERLDWFLNIFHQIAQIAAYAHSKGVIHRDIKPHNIMVGELNELQLIDWGLAKRLGADNNTEAESAASNPDDTNKAQSDSRTTAKQAVGTPGYMAPEQARGEVERVDARADVFALGAVLSEILTARRLYDGAPDEQLAASRSGDLTAAFRRIEESKADSMLQELATQCLAANPDDRLSSANDVAQRMTLYFERLATNRRQTEIKLASTLASAKSERRNRWLIALATGLVLAVAAVGISFYRHAQSQKDRNKVLQGEFNEAQKSFRTHLLRGREELANAQLQRMKAYAESVKAEPLQTQFKQALRDAALIDKLNELRVLRSRVASWGRISDKYRETFTSYLGVDLLNGSTEAHAKRIRASHFFEPLFVGLSEWRSADRSSATDPLEPIIAVLEPETIYAQIKAQLMKGQDPSLLAELIQSSPYAIWQLTIRQQERGRQKEAVAILKQVRLAHPDHFWINLSLANWLRETAPNEAARYASSAIAISPESDLAYGTLAWIESDRNDLAASEAAWRHSLRINPDLAAGHGDFAEVLRKQGNLKEAKTHALMGVKLDPKMAPGFQKLANVCTDLKQFQEALAAAKKGVEVSETKREKVSLLATLASAYLNVKDMDGFGETIERLVEVDPNNVPAMLAKGQILRKAGKLIDAEKLFAKCVALEGENVQALDQLGHIRVDQKKYAQAEEVFRRCLALKPSPNTDRMLGLVESLYFQHKTDELIELLKRASSEISDERFPLYLSQVYEEQKDFVNAEKWIRAALKINAGNVHSHYNLAMMLSAQGRDQDAVAAYLDAIQVDDTVPQVFCNLGLRYRALAEYEKALEALERGHALAQKDPNWDYPSQKWLEDSQAFWKFEQLLTSGKNLKIDDSNRTLLKRMASAYLKNKKKLNFATTIFIKLSDKAPIRMESLSAAESAVLYAAQSNNSINSMYRDLALVKVKELARGLANDAKQQAKARELSQKALTSEHLSSVRDEENLKALPKREQDSWREIWREIRNALKTPADASKRTPDAKT